MSKNFRQKLTAIKQEIIRQEEKRYALLKAGEKVTSDITARLQILYQGSNYGCEKDVHDCWERYEWA